ncbi:MAG TPA: GspMb/PilO family protein [Vicinamibacterales bacterium]|jgi:type IV pilus assembly protein PilO|nr:GspMb/PilO family protein [Vicinamibacterales bacterium]
MSTLQRALSEKRRIIVPLALAIAANVALYAVVVFPLGRQVVAAQTQAQAEHEELNRARLDYQSAKATVTGKQQADAALQKFYKDVLPADQSIARRLTYTRLAQLAKQANVKLEHGTNSVAHEKGSTLSKLSTTYTLTGDYRDVRRFIYSLETAPEFIVLENIGLTSGSEQPGRGLSMNLDIATYFRSGDVHE